VRLGTRAKRIVWWCFEIGIALLVVELCYFLAVEKPPFLFPIKWLGLAMSTLILFGYLINWQRGYLASGKFWLYWCGFLCMHLIVIGLLVSVLHKVPLVLFAFTTLIEASLIIPAFIKLQARVLTKDRSARN
jgi:hypothetical protein